MPITYGKVTSKKPKDPAKKKAAQSKESTDEEIEILEAEEPCSICRSPVSSEDRVTCFKPGCRLISHLICLAKSFRKDDMILPIEGSCPICASNLLWGDLIRKKIGCNMHLDEEDAESDSSDD